MAKLSCCFGQMGRRKTKEVVQDSYERFDLVTPGNLTRFEGSVKHSLSRVLFSRSKELSWWKSFLRNRRNLFHKPWNVKQHSKGKEAGSNKNGGYNSKSLQPIQPNKAKMKSEMLSPDRSFTGEFLDIDHNSEKTNVCQSEVSGIFPQNQWVAFSMELSPLRRVDQWVKDLQLHTHLPDKYNHYNYDHNTDHDGSIIFLPSPDSDKFSGRSTGNLSTRQDNLFQDTVHTNSFEKSLNSSSTVARLSSMGLRSIPTISSFRSIRSVNLSNNKIAHITPRSLPKCLHKLNLSRNKIFTIEGLRELTRLRELDLSYNNICRIGQGLSNCSKITELNLARNKIRVVEGLHRLGKLIVLDLSFNKITTTKALEKLVVNYNSLKALNILGNPVQTNTSKYQLDKAVSGVLMKLVYLNKQPIKPQRIREVMSRIQQIGDGRKKQESRIEKNKKVDRENSRRKLFKIML